MLIKYEQGIGLLEVLVALLLLAIAVLGFSAMQMRSIQATNETLTRSDAMVMVRNIAEDLRLNPTEDQKQAYIEALGDDTDTGKAKKAQTIASQIDCADMETNQPCGLAEQTTYNAKQALLLAEESGVSLGAFNCPGSGTKNIQKICLVASWDETKAIMESDSVTDEKACADKNGTYKPKTSCIVMETY